MFPLNSGLELHTFCQKKIMSEKNNCYQNLLIKLTVLLKANTMKALKYFFVLPILTFYENYICLKTFCCHIYIINCLHFSKVSFTFCAMQD